MKLFMDDQWELSDRYRGPDWTYVRTVEEARELLRANRGFVTHLSLDSDLGEGNLEGPALTQWLSEEYFVNGEDFWPTEEIHIHSRNSQGRAKMCLDINNPRYNPRPEMLCYIRI